MMQFKKLFFAIVFSTTLLGVSSYSHAQSVEEIQGKISQRNETIKQLEQEISKYQTEIDALGKEASSLKNTITSLDLSKKKLETDLKVTQNKIDATNLEIKQLSLAITDKGERITDSKRVISQSLSSIDRISSNTLLENLIGSETLADAWHSAEELNILQSGIGERIHSLASVKASLEDNKKQTENKKAELIALQKDLSGQQKAIIATTNEKNAILKETKNNEAAYNKLLATRKQQKEAFEREVDSLEAALKIAIDPSSIPHTGTGVLNYPLDKITITQYFGNTKFATKNPQIYSAGTHPGIDFGASIGTPVKAALGGVVVGAGNMDLGGGGRCRAYGKWVMIKHSNGLSTLYGHLSVINVSMGDNLVTGEILGYSGNTGATTGPHLHFGVYATQGVRITNLVSSSYCSGVLYPLADPKAYLNPLSFL
jgi:murein DD-endopeptidase MepM/ murein hydrolase activator NlpD